MIKDSPTQKLTIKDEDIKSWQHFLTQMEQSLESLLLFIEEEHEAIRKSDIEAFEIVVNKKTHAVSVLESSTFQMMSEVKRIFGLESTPRTPITISDLLDKIKIMLNETESSQRKKLKTMIDQCQRVIDFYASCKKSFHVNQLVLKKVLAKRQENLKFWEQVTQDYLSTYHEAGKKKPGKLEGPSMIRIKA